MHYEINPETFAISFYDGVNTEPYQYQPDYPNTDKFDSYQEAETWAELSIQAHNPEYRFFAPIGKGLAGEPKPTETEIAEAKLLRTGLTVEELKSLLGL